MASTAFATGVHFNHDRIRGGRPLAGPSQCVDSSSAWAVLRYLYTSDLDLQICEERTIVWRTVVRAFFTLWSLPSTHARHALFLRFLWV